MGYAGDLQSIGLIGGGAEGFIKGWQDADDKKMKQMELDSKLKTDDESRQRAQVMQAIQLKQAGLQQGQTDPTQLEDAPLSQRQINANNLSGAEKGITTTTNPDTGVDTFAYNHDSPQWRASNAKLITAGNTVYKTDHKNDVSQKDWDKLSDAMDPNKARGGNFAKIQAKLNQADSVDQILKQFPDGNIPAAQQGEFATGVASLISGGSPQSQHQINMLIPKSAQGDAEKVLSWFSGSPHGAEQQEFIKVMAATAERERNLAAQQKLAVQRGRLPNFQRLKAADSDRYYSYLHAQQATDPDEGSDPYADPQGLVSGGLTKQHGLVTAPAGGKLDNHPQDAEAIAWATANPKDPRSAAILKANGQ